MSAPTTPGGRPGGASRRGPEVQSTWSGRLLLGLGLAELRKALSTWAWWSLLLAAALFCLISTYVPAKLAGLAPAASLAQAHALGWYCSKFVVLFGVVSATSEARHRTITTSYLSAPGRPQLMAAKVAVAAMFGVGYAVFCSVCGLLGTLLGGGGSALAGELGALIEVSLASLVVYALWAALGVGAGTLIDNQLAAVLVVLILLFPVDPIVVGIAGLMGPGNLDGYTPSSSASAVLTGVAGDSPSDVLFTATSVPWWLALMIFVGYTAVAVLAGATAAQRRDIT